MDKPIIAYDRFDGGRRQVHRIVGTVPPELAAFGLAIIHGSRLLRGGVLEQPPGFRRSFDFYCLSHLVEGEGIYHNADTGQSREFHAGELVMAMPGTAQLYGGNAS